MNSFYTREELRRIGLKSFGDNVLISKKASIYDPQNIEIGNNVRIDDFCILSGKIKIGNYVHISAFNALYGKEGIEIGNFSGLSPRCSIYSAVDDFSGNSAVGPMFEENFRSLNKGNVVISNYVQIGANSIIFPSIKIPEGVSTGAFTLINKDSLREWSIYIGIPAKKTKNRSKNILSLIKNITKNI